MSETLGRALRHARERAGLTQAKIADALGVSRAAVGQWELGSTEPATNRLIFLCELLDVDIADVLSGKDLGESKSSRNAGKPIGASRTDDLNFQAAEGYQKKLLINADASLDADSKLVPIVFTQQVRGEFKRAMESSRPGASFVFFDDVADFCPFPPGLTQKDQLKALHVADEDNIPRYELGDLIFIQENRIARPDDYVLIRFVESADLNADGGLFATIGRLVTRNKDRSIIKKATGLDSSIEIDGRLIAALNPILSLASLFGK